MTIGEPTHAFPAWIIDIIAQNAVDLAAALL